MKKEQIREEKIIATVHKNLKSKHPDLLTIIIPRHSTRGPEILHTVQQIMASSVLRSKDGLITDLTDIYIADTMGELGLFYRLTEVVFMGKSLLKNLILVGGQKLDRGFTVKDLIVTYLPRTTKGKSNSDTIEQRCRFFGYKKDYIEACKVYLPNESIDEFHEYVEFETSLRDYLKKYPNHINRDYGQFILAMCYYENIVDEKRDLEPLLKAKNKFDLILMEYPNTDFALDALFKLELIKDRLAGKEMFIARHYLKSKKWIPAINRYKKIIEEYSQTVFVEEALHRLVEINYRIGLVDEAKKYANVLGYNYDSSEWYKASYKVFNKEYKYSERMNAKKLKQKDKKRIITKFKTKFKTLFE